MICWICNTFIPSTLSLSPVSTYWASVLGCMPWHWDEEKISFLTLLLFMSLKVSGGRGRLIALRLASKAIKTLCCFERLPGARRNQVRSGKARLGQVDG